MIRYKITIIYRDEKIEKFDAIAFPSILTDYVEISITDNDFEYLPREAIQRIKVKKYWKDEK